MDSTILVLSLSANVILVVILFQRSLLWHRKIRLWFLKRPDVSNIERMVRTITGQPRFTDGERGTGCAGGGGAER
jgi:hypothetical protein